MSGFLVAAALVLVEEYALRLDDPVDGLLRELADRRVLVDADGSVDGETVPAERSSRASGPARTPRSTIDTGGRDAIAFSAERFGLGR